MSNPIQEHPYDPFQSFSTLCLNNSSSSSSSAVDPSLCSSCFRPHSRSTATPMKRPSPTPPSQQPSTAPTSKNLLLDHQQPNSIPFSKINLPIPFPPSVSPLRRSLSDPTDACNFSPPPPHTQSPAKRLCLNSPLPPLPLRRTVSDPNPNPAPEKTSDSPIKFQKDSPDSK
uniref:Uncharacterized protein n=1 Tax=Cucumis melo TaxID=3656 RepID=A0A9I9CCP2_CUCME